MFNHPDTCPACQTKPYPRAVACQTCGFVGEDYDDYQKLRLNTSRFWPWLAMFLLFVLIMPIVLLFTQIG